MTPSSTAVVAHTGTPGRLIPFILLLYHLQCVTPISWFKSIAQAPAIKLISLLAKMQNTHGQDGG
jgi:hypothetical protein